jgi:Cft2 family RNA processing exonuclease
LQVEYTPGGIHLPEIGLWLDPREACEAAWISHGHSDHARGLHCLVFGTSTTLRFYRMRWPEDDTVQQDLRPLDFGHTLLYRGARLTPYPAGHILGASQLLIEFDDERLLYTGDIKLRPPLCGTPTEIVRCDRLIIESTFGLPIYHFLSADEARERMVTIARECLAQKTTPVFLGYPLGRGQEIAHVLCTAGVPTAVHGAIARYIPEYEAAGYAFPGWEPYDARRPDRALVVVPGMRNYLEASGKNIRVAYVSGWAALDNARTRAGAEELIPYSDHAGFDELLELIDGTGAREVEVVHGYTAPFAHILELRGLTARAPQALAERESVAGEPEG